MIILKELTYVKKGVLNICIKCTDKNVLFTLTINRQIPFYEMASRWAIALSFPQFT